MKESELVKEILKVINDKEKGYIVLSEKYYADFSSGLLPLEEY